MNKSKGILSDILIEMINSNKMKQSDLRLKSEQSTMFESNIWMEKKESEFEIEFKFFVSALK